MGVFGVASFALFFASTLYFGGEALSGHQAGGRYFLSNEGKLTEVSRAVFQFSWWQTISVFITHPLVIIVVLITIRNTKAE